MMRWTAMVMAFLVCTAAASAQENSPYSRYGLGDIVPNQNIVNRALGGITAGYHDNLSVNFSNPATFGNLSFAAQGYLKNTIFDIGAEIDSRTLRSGTPVSRFSATSINLSYLQLGLPIRLKKLNKKGFFMGGAFGLKPLTRVNYKIAQFKRLPGIDSTVNLFEGTGGLNEANVGLGFRFRGFNLGFNTGYRFGTKDYATRVSPINDTVAYFQSNSGNRTNFGGMFLDWGVQYEWLLPNTAMLRFGAHGNLSQNMSGNNTITRETISVDGNGSIFRVDSVFQKEERGTVTYPMGYTVGFTYKDSSNRWLFGADYQRTAWSQYRFFNATDQVRDNWRIKAGAEFLPAGTGAVKKYWSAVRYRAGAYYGSDYINVGSNLPEIGFTFGAGFPLKLRRNYYETQNSILNVAFEMGSRGSQKSTIRENTFRICIGLSVGDLWFNRSKYY
jgi:hypothetical protein